MSNPIYKDGVPEAPTDETIEKETKPKKTSRPRVSRKKKREDTPAVETHTDNVATVDKVEDTTPDFIPDEDGLRTVEDDDDVYTTNIDDVVGNYEEEDEGSTWMPMSSKEPPFDYNYLAKMTAENYNVSRDELFIKRKVRSTDPVASMILGSLRSIDDAHMANPSDFYMDENAMSDNVSRNIWKVMAVGALNQTNMAYDAYRWLQNDTNARWRLGMPLKDGRLRGIRSPAISLDKARASDKRAMDVISDAMNMGKKRDIFLPHSGFSVTVRPPSLSEFVAFERKVMVDRTDFLRKSRGLIYSSESSYIQGAIFDLFVSCITNSSTGNIDPDFLMENISVLDINTIAWVIACAKYPNGFNLTLPCFANPGTCNHYTNEIVAVDKMWIVDHSKISEKQIELASDMKNKATSETIGQYIDEFDYGDAKYVEIQTHDTEIAIRLVLGVPSIGQAFRSANIWRAAIENSANRAFSKPLVGDARMNYVRAQVEATKAMMYEAWVAEIEMYSKVDPTEEVVKIVETEHIREVLNMISGNPQQLSQFLIGVERFINKATVAVVAVPNLACPACGGYHDATSYEEVGHHIIPLDVMSFFTILCRQLIQNSPDVVEALVSKTTQNGEQSTQDTLENPTQEI